jgi:hypothetical protein
VRTPLSARIGIYLILAGLAFDLILQDPNVSWKDALSAIDAVRRLNAKVVLLTARTETTSR